MDSPSRTLRMLTALKGRSSEDRTMLGVPLVTGVPETPGRADDTSEWRTVDEVGSETGTVERSNYRELEEQLRELQLRLEEVEEKKEDSGINTPDRSVPNPGSNLFKPRDVKSLELEQLKNIDASARLQIFFSSVERCAESTQDRLYIASTKVDNQLAVLLNNAQRKGQVKSWEDLKNLLTKEFSRSANFNEAWQQVVGVRYSWHNDPHAFAQKFKCNYSAIESSFPTTPLPDRDTQIKNLLVNGFPAGRSREYLRTFCHESVTLEHFLTQCLYEKAVMERGTPGNDKVLSMGLQENHGESGAEGIHPVSQRERDYKTFRSAGLAKETATAVTPFRPGQRGASAMWCTYCRTDTHAWRDCVYRPTRGECWDCKRTGCRRGKPGCPGKGKVSTSEQNWRRPNPNRKDVSLPKVRNTEAQGTSEEQLESQTEEQ